MQGNWLRRPGVAVAAVVGLSLVALGAGYGGVSAYLARAASAAAAPLPTRPPPTPVPSGPGPLVIHATGDVNLDPRQVGILRSSHEAPWTGVRELFRSDDLTIVNLECAAADGGEPAEKQFTFRCDPAALPGMRGAGVDVANLGNNHSLDYGRQVLVDARNNLIAAGIAPVGAGRDTREANQPAIFELNGWRVAVLGFSGVVPEPGWFAGANHPGVANGYSIPSMVAAVREAKATADLVLVTIHWGVELATEPRAADVERAHALVDAGADAVFGHHAHVLQPLRWYKDRPIFFGLGNFVWPRGGPTGVAHVAVSPEGAIEACLLAATISGGRPALAGPTSCSG